MMFFAVKRDEADPRFQYIEIPGDNWARRWGSLKEATRFASRKEAYEAAVAAMQPWNKNVRVVRVVPPVPCSSCNGTGRLRAAKSKP